MKVIVPCCGNSTRFPNLPPKWMLPDHEGRPMIREAISKLSISPSDIIITVLRAHEEKFGVVRGLAETFGPEIQSVILEHSTRSQSETVMKTLEAARLQEPFLVKDSDNCFALNEPDRPYNYVCYDSLNNHSLINPKNKSYLQLDGREVILNIKEKMVISDTFSVGGYFFSDPTEFKESYDKLSSMNSAGPKELYLSDIISAMILGGALFKGVPVSEYQDWGTIDDWKRFLLGRKSFFVSLDGFLFERGSEYFEPTYNNAKPNAAAVTAIKELRAHGHTVILLSIRPKATEQATQKQLEEAGLGDVTVVFECPISRWELVTSPYHGIPFRTSVAHEVKHDDPDIFEQLTQ